ncbi:TIGR02530 family flagellar biosynthesis protein [Anaerocolumna sp. AGMB13025]|uniref:TIGR02530 family flagellar biosynthesis protein n=1 Tax=Anaerocolumna sp. AGMB13025 TaxID=3039116 RepID=UPI00241CB937|nr:TIGR02530 family flagellar biosynthesis protein [Anaerocolumna sp. AGMB13025]WFR54975.1 TIGR02530 family flagellar biosynthesis protein [Anaerocolumna sp. AGMB13025]
MNQIAQTSFSSIELMTGQLLKNKSATVSRISENSNLSFQELLEKQQISDTGALKFSKHANERLASRNIDLSEEQLKRLESGAKRAQEKGINESLVMVDNIAFIVNIKNKTVVTAVNDSDDKVFTNIDGAVII